MRVSAKVDYAVRAGAELAVAVGTGPVKGERIAQAQDIPLKFLENILLDLKHAGLVQSQRGAEGGYWLAQPPEEIAVADVIRAVEGPIANVRGSRPEQVAYGGAAEPLREVWIAAGPDPNHYVDVTETFPRKIAALRAHESQTGHMDDLTERIRTRLTLVAQQAGLPAGRLAEVFRVLDTA